MCSATNPTTDSDSDPRAQPLAIEGKRYIIRDHLAAVIFLALALGAARALDWYNAWLYTLVILVIKLIAALVLTRVNPAVLNARGTKQAMSARERVFFSVFMPSSLAMPIVAGLEVGGAGWSHRSEFWDDIAEKYAAKPVEDVPAYQRKLELTRAQLKPDDIVLDVGCGTGSLALELAPHVREVHAMDVSGEMLKFGKQKALDAKARNITFHQATLERGLSFPDESFDVVCAFNILHLLGDREGSLARIFNLLKPGGQLISTTPAWARA